MDTKQCGPNSNGEDATKSLGHKQVYLKWTKFHKNGKQSGARHKLSPTKDNESKVSSS